MSGLKVIVEDLKKHPECPHGPTLLFSRKVENNKERRFFACAACRDRKGCSFFLWQDDVGRIDPAKKKFWEKQKKKYLGNINHRKLFLILNEVNALPEAKRKFCTNCSSFEFDQFLEKHESHKLIENITDYQLARPSEILPPLSDAKAEAQYLFTKLTVSTLVDILKKQDYRNIICIGAPRIHEHITNECPDMNSILLDIDKRYHNFFGPMQYCWYNMFNNHFFHSDAKEVFEDYLQTEKGNRMALVIDPPFGGRVEPLAQTLTEINKSYKQLNKRKTDLPVFWIFPYFMEPQIKNSLPDYSMLDYKVDYDNHPLFQKDGRKQGSPVRIFTNVDPSLITLPEDEGYKFCKPCKKWVSSENKHCKICKECTSKDGRTYKHCEICKRCVKPTWNHCEKCNRCGQENHKCGDIVFTDECFHCKKSGHKKSDCPDLKSATGKKDGNKKRVHPDSKQTSGKRKKDDKVKGGKKKKQKIK